MHEIILKKLHGKLHLVFRWVQIFQWRQGSLPPYSRPSNSEQLY